MTVLPYDASDDRAIDPLRGSAAQRQFAFGRGQETSGQFDLKRFMRLARGMGIPSDDAARLAMNVVFEQRRSVDLGAGELGVRRALE